MLVLACNPTHLEQENSLVLKVSLGYPEKSYIKNKNKNGKTKIPKLKKKKSR